MEKCGRFGGVVGVWGREDVEWCWDGWDDDGVFQGGGWVK